MKEFIIKNGILEKYEGEDAEVVLPDGITYIDEYAFKDCLSLQRVTMSNSVTHIGKGAFYNCKNLQGVMMPDTLKIIEAWAFSCCNNLENITIPSGVFSLGEGAFFYCTNLRSAFIPNGVTEISFHTFNGCRNLQSVTIPDSATNIEYEAFCNCERLQSLSIGNGITEIHKDAFPDEMNIRKWVLAPNSANETQCKMLLDTFGTSNLALSFLLGTMETNDIIRKKLKSRVTNKTFREYFIPALIARNESAAIIKMLSLVKKMSVEEIDFYIDKSAFTPEIRALLLEYKNRLYPTEILAKMEETQMEKDFGLREKTLADYKKIFSIKKENGIYFITKYKGKDINVIIPSQIKGIPVRFVSSAFQENEQIEIVYLEDGITSIENSAFANCSHLQSISIPESVTYIGEGAFSACNKLTVYALEGSYAEKYAQEMHIKFKPI